VLIGTLPSGIKIDNVSIDSNKGIEMAVAHLKETGRKKVAFINGPLATNPGKRRNLGFIAAMEKYKLKINEGAITFLSDFTSEAAIEGLKTADSLKKFDSIICANDLIAAGVIKILLESNMDVGPEIAVIGMDNTELGKILTPSLTSIDLLAEKRGEVAAQLLLERMNDGQIPPRKVELKSTIVIRDSSRI
jgi:LacI family transcriptional regulator